LRSAPAELNDPESVADVLHRLARDPRACFGDCGSVVEKIAPRRRDGASARLRRTPILETMFGGVNCRVRLPAHVTVSRGVLSLARFFARRLGPA